MGSHMNHMKFCEEVGSAMKKEGENQRRLSKIEHESEVCQGVQSSLGRWQPAGKEPLDMI